MLKIHSPSKFLGVICFKLTQQDHRYAVHNATDEHCAAVGSNKSSDFGS